MAAEGGIAVTLGSLGATIMRIDAPDRAGNMGNVLLGSDDLARYPAAGARGTNAYMGAICGRVANRIAGASFTLDGTRHMLMPNEEGNQLHGGPRGFSHFLWHGEALSDGVRMIMESPDGDQGFPGALRVRADYRLLDPHTLSIAFRAETDRPTHVNLVSHGYFNLRGAPGATIHDHELRIAADSYLPVDAAALPLASGSLPVQDTGFDLRNGPSLGTILAAKDEQIRMAGGFNHTFALPGGDGVRHVADLRHPGTGRRMALSTDQRGLLIYTSQDLDGSFAPVAGAPGFGPYAGVCLEAQNWPDAANRPDFPSTRLDPGEVYHSETRLSFGTDEEAPAAGR
jgi:aldose 1-epimerase